MVGFNYQQNDCVINLTSESRDQVAYMSGNTCVIYDYSKNVQALLQGHCNMLTCIIYNLEKDILISSEKGLDSMLIIWAVSSRLPLRCIFDPHQEGVQSMSITEDGRHLVTLSQPSEDEFQEVKVWDLEDMEAEQPLLNSIKIKCSDLLFQFISINSSHFLEFVLTGKK